MILTRIIIYSYAVIGVMYIFVAFSKVITGSLSYFYGDIWCEHACTNSVLHAIGVNISLRIIYFNQLINQSINGLGSRVA